VITRLIYILTILLLAGPALADRPDFGDPPQGWNWQAEFAQWQSGEKPGDDYPRIAHIIIYADQTQRDRAYAAVLELPADHHKVLYMAISRYACFKAWDANDATVGDAIMQKAYADAQAAADARGGNAKLPYYLNRTRISWACYSAELRDDPAAYMAQQVRRHVINPPPRDRPYVHEVVARAFEYLNDPVVKADALIALCDKYRDDAPLLKQYEVINDLLDLAVMNDDVSNAEAARALNGVMSASWAKAKRLADEGGDPERVAALREAGTDAGDAAAILEP